MGLSAEFNAINQSSSEVKLCFLQIYYRIQKIKLFISKDKVLTDYFVSRGELLSDSGMHSGASVLLGLELQEENFTDTCPLIHTCMTHVNISASDSASIHSSSLPCYTMRAHFSKCQHTFHLLTTISAALPSGAVRDIIFMNETRMNDPKHCKYYWESHLDSKP